jgi:deoxyribose-phosphate aldolase
MASPAPLIDHTLLHPTTTEDQILLLCEEAVENGFAAVCIPPCFVRQAAERLYGSGVAVGTVVGFPLGYSTSHVKQIEAQEAVAAGAVEIDMVIQQGWAASGDYRRIEAEIAGIVQRIPDACVKVIIESCRLTDPVRVELVEAVVRSGAAYIKTSTGFAEAGASVADVRLLASVAAGRIGVKAAGGIRDLESCRQLIAAGATRIGTSRGCQILSEWRREEGLE